MRVPTLSDYAAFDGGYSRKAWTTTPDDWRCPSCSRTKFELLRWTLRRPPGGTPFMGWMAALHRHHDHGKGADGFEAFAEIIICDQCNGADGEAKRRLGLPASWSFTPDEIATFVTVAPHGRRRVDLKAAAAAYERAKPINPFES
jgi:hypothetical protein